MYSVYDVEHKRYLYTGRNCESKEQAVKELQELFEPELELAETFELQIEQLENMGYEFEEHKRWIKY